MEAPVGLYTACSLENTNLQTATFVVLQNHFLVGRFKCPNRSFITSIRNLKAAGASACDIDIAMPGAQFDLENMATGAINLLGD
jgi:hypothetical protein